MPEYKKQQLQKEALIHQEVTEQHVQEQQLEQMPVQEERLEQDSVRQLQQMESAAPELLVHPAEPAFQKLTAGYQQQNRKANKHKLSRKVHAWNIQKHDVKVCDKKVLALCQADKTDTAAQQAGQFSLQIQQDLTSQLMETHTEEEIDIMREKLPGFGILREDVTGYDRRSRAALYEKEVPDEKQVTRDANNLIHNYHVDLYLTSEYKPCQVISKFNDAYKASAQITEEDIRLQTEIDNLNTKIGETENKDEKAKLTAQKAALKGQLKKFSEMALYTKNIAGQHGMRVETLRVRLTAMDKALKQLELEQQNSPSAYTEAMIEKVKEQMGPLQADIQSKLDQFTNPTFDSEIMDEEAIQKKSAAFKPMLQRIYDLAEAFQEKKANIANGMDENAAEAAYVEKTRNLIRSYTES